ncbi:hypothetical protein [Klenkia brasiliensis]|uniref:Uncharacterized protein n=1 Tax=Klenkia brasiliensis TaxID=333142 RepID=A0A1G7V8D1_9ACTN|nr:hypothetical protein [Klenkia brasiliensis]SDG56135.1 hypothetical protein SAMN05660324_2965 [Klenkia brasiliensis]
MWSQAFGAEEDGQRPVWQPPDNEVPVGVPLAALLARTDDVAVALTGAQVYSTGVALDLVVTTRSAAEELHEHVFGGRRGRGPLLGVQFADGRRGSLHGEGGDVLLTSRGGGGGGRSVQQGLWLHPVPPAGPLSVVVLAPGLGIDETRTGLDGGPLAAAVRDVVELWPWEPEDAAPGLVEPDLDLPEGSWFRA